MTPSTFNNRLLGLLTADDRARVGSHLVHQRLPLKQVLFEPDVPVTSVWFVESGMVSLVTDMADGATIETGTVGHEGLVGLPVLFGSSRSTTRAFAQIEGDGYRLPAHVLDRERERSTPWFHALLRFANFMMTMTAQSAACNRMHAVEARMCRWLLMTHDRVQTNELALTQQFLSEMLGVARPTVNITGSTLQRAGYIKYGRGRVTVLDRSGLESGACECYERIRTELDAVFEPESPAYASRGAKR